jgi:hypothetical protein
MLGISVISMLFLGWELLMMMESLQAHPTWADPHQVAALAHKQYFQYCGHQLMCTESIARQHHRAAVTMGHHPHQQCRSKQQQQQQQQRQAWRQVHQCQQQEMLHQAT